MTEKIREELDPDRSAAKIIPTRLRTDTNTQVVTCSSCGDAYYVDKTTFDSMVEAIGYDPDNSFTCPRCEEEGDADSRR